MLDAENEEMLPVFQLHSVPPARHVVLILEIIPKCEVDILWFNGFPAPIKFFKQWSTS